MDCVMAIQPKAKRGRPKGALTVPHQERAIVAQDALHRLETGETTEQIAKSYGIEPRTLRSWIIIDCPDEATHQRARFISNEQQKAIEEMSVATEQIPLARAREMFKAWSWIGERRVPAYFGQKQEVTMTVNVGLADKLLTARSRVIEGEYTPDSRKLSQSKDS